MPGLSSTRVSGCVVCEIAPWDCEIPMLATVAVAPMRKDLLPVRSLSHVSCMHTKCYLQLCKPTNGKQVITSPRDNRRVESPVVDWKVMLHLRQCASHAEVIVIQIGGPNGERQPHVIHCAIIFIVGLFRVKTQFYFGKDCAPEEKSGLDVEI